MNNTKERRLPIFWTIAFAVKFIIFAALDVAAFIIFLYAISRAWPWIIGQFC